MFYFHSKAKSDTSESDALRHELDLEQAERQRMKEERDGVQTRLNNAEMALQMMEKKEKESLRQVGGSNVKTLPVKGLCYCLQKSQDALLMEKFDEERAEHKKTVNAHACVVRLRVVR